MEDSIKSIFRILIKVPCIIVGTYLIFNMLFFVIMYFRGYAAAQMITNIVSENNYVPSQELGLFNDYVNSNLNSGELVNGVRYEISTVTDNAGSVTENSIGVQLDSDGNEYLYMPPYNAASMSSASNADVAKVRAQYGSTATVELYVTLQILIPLHNAEKGGANYEEHWSEVTIPYRYTVPCLKYYSDLA